MLNETKQHTERNYIKAFSVIKTYHKAGFFYISQEEKRKKGSTMLSVQCNTWAEYPPQLVHLINDLNTKILI